MTNHAYTIRIRKVTVDGATAYEGRVVEFPDLIEYGDSVAEAYELVDDAIQVIAKVFAENGRSLPSPRTVSDDFNGRVTLRMPYGIHRALVLEAESEGVSLNQFIVTALANYLGGGARWSEGAAERWSEPETSRTTVQKRPSHLRVVSSRNVSERAQSWTS